MPLLGTMCNSPYTQFNGFKDTGDGLCVPETMLHHLKVNGRNKKLTLEKVIETLEEVYPDDDDDYEYFMKMPMGK